MKQLLRMGKKVLIRLYRSLSDISIRSRHLWLFGAWHGELYADNTKYLFEYVNRSMPRIKAVWMTNNRAVCRQVRRLGYRACMQNSLRGMWYALHAKVAFETEGDRDVAMFPNRKRMLMIQCWHGMGTKAMRWKSEGIAAMKETQHHRLASYHWMATSQLYIDTFTDLLDLPADIFTITGYPRNDTFVTKPRSEHMERLRAAHPDEKFIIYMPTHRNFGRDGNDTVNLSNLRLVDEQLRAHHIIMVYKPHIHELQNFLAYEESFTNIILAKEPEIWGDVYAYLHDFDLLISDYSSVLSDFMCSGKPVIVFAYDIDHYIKDDAGLNEYFWTLQGGPLCRTWDELIDAAVSQLACDTWKDERERCRIQYHLYNDGKNCERVCETVMQLLAENKKRR